MGHSWLPLNLKVDGMVKKIINCAEKLDLEKLVKLMLD